MRSSVTEWLNFTPGTRQRKVAIVLEMDSTNVCFPLDRLCSGSVTAQEMTDCEMACSIKKCTRGSTVEWIVKDKMLDSGNYTLPTVLLLVPIQ